MKPLAHRYLRQRLPKVRERNLQVHAIRMAELVAHEAGIQFGERRATDRYTQMLAVEDGETLVGARPQYAHLRVALPPMRVSALFEPARHSLGALRLQVARFDYQKMAIDLESEHPMLRRALVWFEPKFRGIE